VRISRQQCPAADPATFQLPTALSSLTFRGTYPAVYAPINIVSTNFYTGFPTRSRFDGNRNNRHGESLSMVAGVFRTE
jgi:hypothetical protein